MAKYGFPFMVLTLIVVMGSSAATDYVGGMVKGLATQTGATIAAQR